MPDGGIIPRYLTLDVDEAIANWAAWSRTRRGAGHCASIEGDYRHPRHRTTSPAAIPIDLHSAMTVERAMCQVPHQHQKALTLHYVARSPASYICRQLALNRAAWPQFLADARTMLTNLLLKSGKWRIQSGYNSTPAL